MCTHDPIVDNNHHQSFLISWLLAVFALTLKKRWQLNDGVIFFSILLIVLFTVLACFAAS